MLQLTMNSDVAKFRQYMHMGGFEVMQVRLEWARNASAKERSYKNYFTSQSIAAISMVVTSVCGDRYPWRSLLVQLLRDTSILREGTEGALGASWWCISRLASARVSQHVLPRSPSPAWAPCRSWQAPEATWPITTGMAGEHLWCQTHVLIASKQLG